VYAILLIYAFSKRPQTAKGYKSEDLATNEDIDLETVIKTVCGRDATVELIGIV
jgi:hypothetical protein